MSYDNEHVADILYDAISLDVAYPLVAMYA